MFPNLTERPRTYQLKKLVEAEMLQPIRNNARVYTINFINNILILAVMHILVREGFVPPLN